MSKRERKRGKSNKAVHPKVPSIVPPPGPVIVLFLAIQSELNRKSLRFEGDLTDHLVRQIDIPAALRGAPRTGNWSSSRSLASHFASGFKEQRFFQLPRLVRCNRLAISPHQSVLLCLGSLFPGGGSSPTPAPSALQDNLSRWCGPGVFLWNQCYLTVSVSWAEPCCSLNPEPRRGLGPEHTELLKQ